MYCSTSNGINTTPRIVKLAGSYMYQKLTIHVHNTDTDLKKMFYRLQLNKNNLTTVQYSLHDNTQRTKLTNVTTLTQQMYNLKNVYKESIHWHMYIYLPIHMLHTLFFSNR